MMKTIVHTAIRELVGQRTYAKLRSYRRQLANQHFAAKQATIQLQVGDFVLSSPSEHLLARVQSVQPYRDLAIGIVARELARKYPGETLLDIGANIGDTAAIMATYSPSPKILVEPSSFFLVYLQQNAARIPNIRGFTRCLSLDASGKKGFWYMGGGRRASRRFRGRGRGWTASSWWTSRTDRHG